MRGVSGAVGGPVLGAALLALLLVAPAPAPFPGAPTAVPGWVWVRARWGDDFEPFGPRLRGVRLTWEAFLGSATGGRYNSWITAAFAPPVWDDLPDYSGAVLPWQRTRACPIVVWCRPRAPTPRL